MANEMKLAKAARSIARELFELPEGSEFPFGTGRAFTKEKAPCCVIGHVIQRAGLTPLLDGSRPLTWVANSDVFRQILDVFILPTEVWKALAEVAGANDDKRDVQAVAEWLYVLADALELAAAPSTCEAR